MTADIRTAAQREAAEKFHWHNRDAKITSITAFVSGAAWGAARATPTREQLIEALWNLPINVITMKQLKERAASGAGDYRETLDYVYDQADAVLALMDKLAEGEGAK